MLLHQLVMKKARHEQFEASMYVSLDAEILTWCADSWRDERNQSNFEIDQEISQRGAAGVVVSLTIAYTKV